MKEEVMMTDNKIMQDQAMQEMSQTTPKNVEDLALSCHFSEGLYHAGGCSHAARTESIIN